MHPGRQGFVRTSCLTGRNALVIGGSGGIGARVAAELARRGARIAVHGSTPESAGQTARAIERDGGVADPFGLDLDAALARGTPPAGFNAFGFTVRALLSHMPEPDILVVAYGPFLRAPLASTGPEDWGRLTLLNLALPGALASAFLPGMAARRWGRMIFFGGTRTDGIRAYRSNAAYAAAKTGLSVLVKSLAAEGAPDNVAAIAVCPGLVDTEYLDDDTRRSLRAAAPGGILIDPEAIARHAVDLIDADPCPANGAVTSLDGGFAP